MRRGVVERVGSRPYPAVSRGARSLGSGVVGPKPFVPQQVVSSLSISVLLDLVAQATFVAPTCGPTTVCRRLWFRDSPRDGIRSSGRLSRLEIPWSGLARSRPSGRLRARRAHPRRRLALVAAGNDRSAAVLAARVGAYFPELFELKTPARSTTQASGRYVRLHGVASTSGGRRARASCASNADSVEWSAALRAGPWPVAHAAILSAFPHVELVRLLVRIFGRSIRPATVA